MKIKEQNLLKNRFRKFYPVVIDVETSGLNHTIHSLLEISIITLKMNQYGWLQKKQKIHFHIKPFNKSIIRSKSLSFHKINPFHAIRQSVYEYEAIQSILNIINYEVKLNECNKSVIVAHNATFDHNFIMQSIKRYNIKNNPFHKFVTFDTATLSALTIGQTVLSKSCKSLGLFFDDSKAHSALYDTIQTANLFCKIINTWKKLGKWPFKNTKSNIKLD